MGVGDAFLEEIAISVAKKLEERSTCSQRLMELEAAAAYMGMTTIALSQKSRDGEIPTVRIDKRLRFDRRDLDRFIDRAPRVGV